jgi:hypothetical protein
VTRIVVGHGHWDHAGQIEDFPNAVLYLQREELRAIEWALSYPNPHIKAINSDPGGCYRTPACGYMPLTMENIYGKVLAGKAVIVHGEMEVLPGVKIHPAFRAHTAGSQLLEVPTSIGKLVFGSDAYSSWEGSATGCRPTSSRPTRSSSSWPTRSATTSPAATTTASPPRAIVLYRQVPADQEFLGRPQRLADGRDRAGSGRALAQAQRLSAVGSGGGVAGLPAAFRTFEWPLACPVF